MPHSFLSFWRLQREVISALGGRIAYQGFTLFPMQNRLLEINAVAIKCPGCATERLSSDHMLYHLAVLDRLHAAKVLMPTQPKAEQYSDRYYYLHGMEATGKPLHELFIEVINIRGVHHQLNISNEKVKYFRNRIKNGYYVEERSMREILKKMGYEKKSDEIWAK